MTAILSGIRIVELAQYIFVPAALTLLADYGAEVIKVEALEGDPYRTIKIGDGRETAAGNLALEHNNRGKKSIAINLKTQAGLSALLRLLETADVFATSMRPAAIARLGLAPDTLRARFPKLIYARGNGTGFNGPDCDKAGFDAASFWARGGFADGLTQDPDGAPLPTRPALGDHASALSFAMGVMGALLHRERTGEAVLMESSLLANAAWILSSDLCVAGAERSGIAGKSSATLLLPLQRAYRTADGRWVQVMILAPKLHWPSFCHMIGMADALDDPRFTSMEGRIENAAALIAAIAERIAARTWDDWRPSFETWDGAWDLVQTMAELIIDPQMRANDQLFEVSAKDGTPLTLVSGPVAFNGKAAPSAPQRAPELGEHSDMLLQQAGLDDDEIIALRSNGAIR